MYRIHFDPKIGRFIIQVLVLGFIWAPVKKLAESNDKVEQLTFQKFDDAVSHVKSIGLDKLYADKSANVYREQVSNRFYTGPGLHHG